MCPQPDTPDWQDRSDTATNNQNLDEALPTDSSFLDDLTYTTAVSGQEIYNFYGNRVFKHVTSSGRMVAIKVKPAEGFDRSEGDMMNHAAEHGILAPRVLGVYDIVGSDQAAPIARAIVSDLVPGVPLASVWEASSPDERRSYKTQLQHQISLMRACTNEYIGRVDNQSTPNVYDRWQVSTGYCGPWPNETDFDSWCFAHLRCNILSKRKWRRFLDKERTSRPFVLTHGDLTPRNIIVKDGVITGLVDWEQSGFFPDYAEYAFAMALGHEIEEWWLPVLEEVLSSRSKDRVRLTSLLESSHWQGV